MSYSSIMMCNDRICTYTLNSPPNNRRQAEQVVFDAARITLRGPRQRIPLHTHDYAEFTLVTGGSGIHRTMEGDSKTAPGDMFLVRKHHVHGFHTDSGIELLNAAFPEERFVEILRTFELHQFQDFLNNERTEPVRLQIHQSRFHHFEQLLHRISTVAGRGAFFLEKMYYDLAEFAAEDPSMAEVSPSAPAWLQEACIAMGKPENLRLGVKRLQDLCCRCSEHISRTFKTYVGMTPNQYVSVLRLEEAKRLLSLSDKDISEIGRCCGYVNQSHFTQSFKKHFGITPLKFRRQKMGILIDQDL